MKTILEYLEHNAEGSKEKYFFYYKLGKNSEIIPLFLFPESDHDESLIPFLYSGGETVCVSGQLEELSNYFTLYVGLEKGASYYFHRSVKKTDSGFVDVA